MPTVQNTSGTLASDLVNALNGTRSSSASSGTNSTQKTQTDFLNLLVTQLKNQDPLNPMDNAQMTSQLAQINTVDGISKLNATLQTLLTSNLDTQTLQAANLVGQRVMVAGGAINLTQGQSQTTGVELAGPADRVVATITNASGLVVRTMELGTGTAGVHSYNWDGATDAGPAAPSGRYTVSFTATRGTNAVTATALETGTVTSVARSASGVSINVGNLGSFSTSDIKQIL